MKSTLVLSFSLFLLLPAIGQKIEAETTTPGEKAISGINTDNSSTSSYGLFGRSYHGLQLFADGTTGFAGIGTASGVNGIGFYGIAEGVQGRGVLGLHNNIAGVQPGVEGRSASLAVGAIGVLGEITPTNPGALSAGVRGVNKGTGNFGVGVYGSHDGNGWGVYGTVQNASLGFAGYFDGGRGLFVSPKVGINNTTPAVELVVKQAVAVDNVLDAVLTNLSGILIESVGNAGALLYVDPDDDLNFAFGSGTNFTQKAYIWTPTGDFVNLSDKKLKKNIKPMNNVLNEVNKLVPSTYAFNNETGESNTMGFIAQDVQVLFPELVHEKNGTLALAYDKFAVLAIKAIQEQQKIIDELILRLERLESSNPNH